MPPGEARRHLLAAGAAACSDVELLGVLLDGGLGSAAAQVVAEDLLRRSGGIVRLGRDGVPFAALLGPRWRRKLALVRAGLELGRRAAATPLVFGDALRDAGAVYGHVGGRLAQLEREVFLVLLLDGRNRLLGELRISEGTLTAALVHPREVFAPAIRLAAAAIVLIHNHPSGDPTPSADDRVVTEQLVAAGRLLDIPVHDHVIIGRGRYTSFAEAGLL